MALKSSGSSDESYIEPLVCWKKEFRSSVIKIVESSLNSSLIPADSFSSIPDSEDGFYLKKRRKMDEEYGQKIGNMRDSSTANFTTTGYIPSPEHNTDGQSCMVNSSAEFSAGSSPEQNMDGQSCMVKSSAEFSAGSRSGVNSGQPSSSSSVPSYTSESIKDALECLLPDTNTAEPVIELTSARDLCISILKKNICRAKDSELSRTSSTIDRVDNLNSPLFECKKCGLMEDPSKMLICDCCEGAFHLLCCNPHVKKIPDEEWYCLACKRRKPKRQHGKLTKPKVGSSKDIQRPRRGLGPIRDMLVDSESYESEVRIGSMFQAEVPEWSGPIASREDQFAEPIELDPSKMSFLEQFEDKKTSIGNWIQCREVLDTGVVCGKWRRAPLFVVQSSDWDCSCSVVWDPFHADCAVPQELETTEVREQLKYINKLKNRLGDSNQKR